ncbi:MAG: heat shock protein HtpX, partial [Euryarchaeota archaeon]|nr:heat shock protein HtpX [Euryarchaeota archaeon]
SALFITPAITGKSIMNLFSTHPTLEARIAALQKIEMELEA